MKPKRRGMLRLPFGEQAPRDGEFLHVDDLANGLLHLLSLGDPPDFVNVGTGVDVSILELAGLVAEVIGFAGEIITDPSKPDGTPSQKN